MKRILALLLFPTFFFSVSKQPQYAPPQYLVTEIRITCSKGSPEERHFTDQESMGRILQYLRSAEFMDDEADAPVPESEMLYCITLIHSTGRVTVYRQIADLYLCKGSSRWHRLDPEYGQSLDSLYHNLPNGEASAPI